MSKKGWFFTTVGTLAFTVAAAVGLETLAVYNSDQFRNALKANNTKSDSFGGSLIQGAENFFSNVIHRKSYGEIEAENYRSKARTLVETVPGHLPPTLRELANEELARDMMAREIVMNGGGKFRQRAANAYRALKDGKMPEPERGTSWWNKLTGNESTLSK